MSAAAGSGGGTTGGGTVPATVPMTLNADSNNDGKCDENNGGNEGAPILLCDANVDGYITMSDLNAIYALIRSKYPVATTVTPANAWANYSSNGASASTIDINDFWQCYYVGRGMLPKKYTAGVPD